MNRLLFLLIPLFILTGCAEMVVGLVGAFGPGVKSSMSKPRPKDVYVHWLHESNTTIKNKSSKTICILFEDVAIYTQTYALDDGYREDRLWGLDDKLYFFESQLLGNNYEIKKLELKNISSQKRDSCDLYFKRDFLHIDFTCFKQEDYSFWNQNVYWVYTPELKITLLDKNKKTIFEKNFIGNGLKVSGSTNVHHLHYIEGMGYWYLNILDEVVQELKET